MADDQTGTKKKTLNWNFRASRDWGNDWRGYFQEYRAQLAERMEQETVKADKSPQVIIWGHEASGDEPIAPQNMDWADRLHNNAWEYKIGYSQYFKPAANSRSHDKIMDRSYIQAVKRGRMIWIVYQRELGSKSWSLDNFVVFGKPSLALVTDLREEISK